MPRRAVSARHAGGAPHTEVGVPHSRPCLGRDEEEAALRVLRSGRLAPGQEARRCAHLLARATGCADAVLLSSGTTALTMAMRGLGIGERDRVALPSYACAALLHAVRAAGAQPLVCDIDSSTLALDPDDLARRVTADLRAAIVVHPFGVPARIEPLRARGLLVIEDCAQALGARDRDEPVGSCGDAAVFSFAPTKVVTCGGPGGGLASSRAGLVDEVRDLAGHDEKDDARPRWNALMGDLQAAILSVQLSRLREFRDRRAAIARLYDEALAPLDGLRPPPQGSDPTVYRYLVRVHDAERLLEALNLKGITARRPVFRPLHRLMGLDGDFPRSDRAQQEIVSLPLYPALTDGEAERVAAEVRRCLS
ncbi:MAG: hypothetical protein AUH92_04745 [Acidobacteria bacterium 13_1_40CM_4_69_4]|nr:MAG: hypothetical protein AUH92_04745 [Acidobacteria bacterium 13_1_40CM_4_69_4]